MAWARTTRRKPAGGPWATFEQDELHDELVGFSWGAVGRLKPGTSPQDARANLDVIARAIAERMSSKMPSLADFELHALIIPMRDVYFGSVHQGLVMLMGAVGLLLVIGCVNLVNLLLARLTSRARELATRAALGAPRGRLVRQVLTESGGAVVECGGERRARTPPLARHIAFGRRRPPHQDQ